MRFNHQGIEILDPPGAVKSEKVKRQQQYASAVSGNRIFVREALAPLNHQRQVRQQQHSHLTKEQK